MPKWNPQPAHDKPAYYAGYSDGWYSYDYGSGQERPNAEYERGYREGQYDSEANLLAALQEETNT
jgi:hypothetical protein